MNATVIIHPGLGQKYPCLMISTEGAVVLFSDLNIGTYLSGGPQCSTGYHSKTWIMSCFTPFHGEVHLKSD